MIRIGRRGRWTVSLVVGAALWAGCAREGLPPCDDAEAAERARRVVFRRDGRPAFAGQALIIDSCSGGTFCHTPDAEGGERKGVPAGLDFDLRPPSGPGELGRFISNHLEVRNNRNEIAFQVSEGLMPPGAEGAGVVKGVPTYRQGPGADTAELVAIDSDEGRRVLKQWLACDAPVVEEVREYDPEGPRPGDYCVENDPEKSFRNIGVCVVGADALPPEPNWTSIYEEVISPQCGMSCHGPGPPNQIEESQLDLSTKRLAYRELVDAPAAGIECGDVDLDLVEPEDPDSSLLISKLEAASSDDVCGDPMPTGNMISSTFIEPIREWIAAGAQND